MADFIIEGSVTVNLAFYDCPAFFSFFVSIMGRSTRSTAEKGKAKETDVVSKTEAFSQLLMGGEEEFDEYLGNNETLDDDDDDEEPMSSMVPLQEYENDEIDDEDGDEDEDDDKDSLDAWLEDDDQYIDDNEIT